LSRWFNLIISHLPGGFAKKEAIMELRRILRDDVDIVATEPNLIFARVRDPDEAVRALKDGLGEFSTILRVVPVYRVVDPNIDAVKSAVDDLLVMAGEGSFAVRIDGYLRDSDGRLMHKSDAIARIADGIERPVDLRNPDILVYVKVVRIRHRYSAAIYVGPPELIISTTKLRKGV